MRVKIVRKEDFLARKIALVLISVSPIAIKVFLFGVLESLFVKSQAYKKQK